MESKAKMMFNETMSLYYPDLLWKWVPTRLDEWDTNLQKLVSNPGSQFWQTIRQLSATAEGIGLFICLSFLFWYLLGQHSKQRFIYGIKFLAVLLVFLALSDFMAHKLIKIPIGRLKPRVNGVIPGFYQALSFPSNHALNMAFCWAILFGFCKSAVASTGQKNKIILFLGIPLILFIGVSRVVLNEHYPLDVLAGWGLGIILAKSFSRYFVKANHWAQGFRFRANRKI